MNKLNNFLKSPAYVVCVTAVIFLGWLMQLYLPALYIICIFTAFLFFTQKDLTPVIVPVLLISYLFPYHATSINFFAALIPTLPVLLAAIIYYIIKNKPQITRGAYLAGFVIALIGVIPGGLFFDNAFIHFLTVSAVAAALVGIYIIFVSTCKDNFKSTAFNAFTAIAVLILLQVVVFYIFAEDKSLVINYKEIHLGWGISNNIALVLCMLLPVTIYLASQNKPWFYLPMAFLQAAAIFVVKSRGNMLIAAAFLPVLLVVSFLASKQKRVYIYSLMVTFAFVIAAVIIAFPTLKQIFAYSQNLGFDDTGRFDLYREAFENFKLNPIFGVGFYYLHGGEIPHWYHNTILQLLASLGVFGLLMFVPLLWQRYTTPLKRFNRLNFFLLCALVMSGLYALLDVNFFNIYPNLIIICMYIIIEREPNTVNLFKRFKLYPKRLVR